jgi:adenylate cyclase
MLTFRTTITSAVLVFVTTLALLLIIIQVLSFRAAARASASANMSAATARTLTRVESGISELSSLIAVLSINPFLADSDVRSETGGAVGLFRTALQQLPKMDSIYVGYNNGCWLQVRRLDNLDAKERERLGAPAAAAYAVNLVLPAESGDLPLRRVFEDPNGNNIEKRDIWDYGYDVRKRPWYRDTMEAQKPRTSSPYPSFSLGTPVITLSAPLQGKARGVIAADLKLDDLSEFAQSERPGEHGMAVLFDASGTLIAHPDYEKLLENAAKDPARPQLPNVNDLKSGLIAAVLRGWDRSDRYAGTLSDEAGQTYFFRLRRFSLGQSNNGYLLLLAAQDDFAQDIRALEKKAVILAFLVGGCFVPVTWLFGDRMSRSLKRITAQTGRLKALVAPDATPVKSYVKEIHELGATMIVAQRTIWSFARFVPKDIVKGLIDNSISTELGGIRRELTILFTDVRNFTGIAEAADADVLMRQATRYFTALTEVFLAEGGTVDKFIGDSVMVFWNAPNLQSDHVERACRAALSAKSASESLNAQFEAEGLPIFFTRIGVHVGDVVVGNLGSAERMEYTALGTAVNLASRLEGLNKEYGTAILVSEAIRTRGAPYFRFDDVATVIAKGMTKETRVYELIGAIT